MKPQRFFRIDASACRLRMPVLSLRLKAKRGIVALLDPVGLRIRDCLMFMP
jgi:hypothetical protein